MRIYGKNPVLERLRSNPLSIHKLYLQKRTDLSEVVHAAKKAGLDFESVEKEWFKRRFTGAHTQGIAADIKDFIYAPLEESLKHCTSGKLSPVFVDGVTDPHNLGSIIRTLACMGGFSLVLPEHNSVLINETVLRVACGGENHIRISKVPNAVRAVKKFKEHGVRIVGAVAEKGINIIESELVFPVCVVIGSEGKGIRPGLTKQLDIRLSLPMRGAVLSYNVAVATALFCHEIDRKKKLKGA